MHSGLGILHGIREFTGEAQTVGLPDDVITQFLETDATLVQAVSSAEAEFERLKATDVDLLRGSEADLVRDVQDQLVNFYPPECVNPYASLSAKGPWLITTHGAVIHDNGGYGMMGMGHAPDIVLDVLCKPHVMANVMTPSVLHKRFSTRLAQEIGQTRGGCPFTHFILMNSGSESVTVACRISDVNALRNTGPGGKAEGRTVKLMSLEGSFHGRTDRPAQASHSTRGKYREYLASHSSLDNNVVVAPNDVGALEAAYAQADADGVFIELMLMEPVMGEGNPGEAITREFYDTARRLTMEHGSLLLVDSIQAGIRGTGYVSIVDYPGFEGCEAPDLETYSKALNAGQYPMSVLAMTDRAAQLYVRGIYGNTMTANPRALDVACAVLDGLTPSLRQNIRDQGVRLVDKLAALKDEFPAAVIGAQGTGLLFSIELARDIPVVGFDGIETWLRKNGLGVIHGGENSLRFTPHFAINDAEVELLVDLVRQGIRAFNQ